MEIQLFVCRYGFVTVKANNIQDAIDAAQTMNPEIADWNDHMCVCDYEVKEEE